MRGMTLKQMHRYQFLELCRAYKAVDPLADSAAFVRLSVAVHAAKAHVPTSWWRMATRKDIHR